MSLPIENVQNYPRPPVLERVPQTLRVMLNDTIIAETRRGLRVLETHHAPTYYFPPEDVHATLVAESGRSFCEWKGRAQYWTIQSLTSVAWSYPNPTKRFADLADHIAFYPSRMQACFVDDEQVTPQPGDFYGGWVTSNLRGIVKGSAETRHW